ncbi:hypothetical protein EP7_001153 [Isosphaeraceae bacterium EP7]
MPYTTFACARCDTGNFESDRFCAGCGIPLGIPRPDADVAREALGDYEPPDPSDADASRALRNWVGGTGLQVTPSSHGYRVIVPLPLDRKQAVYAGLAGHDAQGRSIIALVSICGPANDRDARALLKLNARAVEGHFAIRVLRGEEYFVVIQNFHADHLEGADPADLVRRIAERADGLEDRLSRGLDLY